MTQIIICKKNPIIRIIHCIIKIIKNNDKHEDNILFSMILNNQTLE
jgi:hypothetical protein